MPSLKEIKTRIASVNSTRKITSAMKMVASSKLHHAQVAIQNMLPYENMLEHILKSFLVSTPNVDHELQVEAAASPAAATALTLPFPAAMSRPTAARLVQASAAVMAIMPTV